MSTRRPGATPVENDLTDLWARLNPVAGYTSGWVTGLPELFIATPAAITEARADLQDLEPAVAAIPDADLRAAATKQLRLLRTQLAYPQPGLAVQDCGDGAFYIGLKEDFDAPFVPKFLVSAAGKVAFETTRLVGVELDAVHRRQCLDAAAYCRQTVSILGDNNPALKPGVEEVEARLDQFVRLVTVPGLDSDDFATMYLAMRRATTGPSITAGYPALLRDLYDFTQSASDIDLTALAWLEQDLPVLTELARELAETLGLPATASVGDVWAAVSVRYAVPGDLMTFAEKAARVCNAFAAEYLVAITPADHVVLKPTPSYLAPVVTGGQDIAVDYLTDKPVAYLYLTPAKNQSMLTMLNIMVHEFSHGFNFVLAAKHAGSPLLNLGGPMQVALTEGQAFWREWEYWNAAATAYGGDLTPVQQAYLALYGSTEAEQSRAIRAAQFETYVWRVVRYLRALCDVQVNSGWRTLVGFLDWAAETTGLSVEFLYGECFTFLAQPGYAPAYAVDGIEYGRLQREALARGVTQLRYDTYASAMGFFPWTTCAARLAALEPSEPAHPLNGRAGEAPL